MERGRHLQLAAEGPLGLQGGLHGEWPWARPMERLCGHFLQEAHSACPSEAGSHSRPLMLSSPKLTYMEVFV